MMQKYEPMWDERLGRIKRAERRIVSNLSDAPPIYSAPYPAGPEQRELEREEVAQTEQAGVSKPAVIEGASHIVVLPKKDGSICYCVNYC